MNFTQDWLLFLRADLQKIGIELPTLPDAILPQYYLAILHKLKSAQENGLSLTIEELRTVEDVEAMLSAEKLAAKCLQEIAANQQYITDNETEIRRLLIKQCPELDEEAHRIYLSWSAWDECEMVFEFVKSRIGLRERLKLRLAD